MLAQVAGNHRQRRPILVGTGHADGESQRNRRGARFPLDDINLRARLLWWSRGTNRVLVARRQLLEVGGHLRCELLGIPAGQPDQQVGLRVVLLIERLHVIQRQLLQCAEGAGVGVTVRVLCRVDHVVEHFFAQFFVVIGAQRHLQVVDLVRLDALEVFFAETGIEQHVPDQTVVLGQVVNVGGAAEDGHFLVHLRPEIRRHWVHGFPDFGCRQSARAPFRQHGSGQCCQAFLTLGIGRRPGGKQDVKRDQRGMRGHQQLFGRALSRRLGIRPGARQGHSCNRHPYNEDHQ